MITFALNSSIGNPFWSGGQLIGSSVKVESRNFLLLLLKCFHAGFKKPGFVYVVEEALCSVC